MKKYVWVAALVVGFLFGSILSHSVLAYSTLIERLKGRILLQVESKGEAWYVNPDDGKRYLLGRPQDALNLMRRLGIGIRNADLAKIPEANNSSWCTADPVSNDIGGVDNPVDPKYQNLNELGQIFTAADCGETRLKKLYGGYTNAAGSTLYLNSNPSPSFVETLKKIGYVCESGSENVCRNWNLHETVTLQSILLLKPYYNYISAQDCINCG